MTLNREDAYVDCESVESDPRDEVTETSLHPPRPNRMIPCGCDREYVRYDHELTGPCACIWSDGPSELNKIGIFLTRPVQKGNRQASFDARHFGNQ
jgi:hypothetical protein